MKQRITADELNKLTDAQKEMLRDWWLPRPGDFFINEFSDRESLGPIVLCMGEAITFYSARQEMAPYEEEKQNCLPLLSIGQMIEFIEEKKPLLKGISKNRFNKWCVNIDNGMLGYKDELCDALFEAVKQILKQP